MDLRIVGKVSAPASGRKSKAPHKEHKGTKQTPRETKKGKTMAKGNKKTKRASARRNKRQ